MIRPVVVVLWVIMVVVEAVIPTVGLITAMKGRGVRHRGDHNHDRGHDSSMHDSGAITPLVTGVRGALGTLYPFIMVVMIQQRGLSLSVMAMTYDRAACPYPTPLFCSFNPFYMYI